MTDQTVYRIEFGPAWPVPPITVDFADRAAAIHTVTEHAIPHLKPVLAAKGRPELADCFFRTDRELTEGSFMWISLAEGMSALFCPARLTPAAAAAALAEDLRYVLGYRGPGHAHEQPGIWDTSGKPCGHCARLAVAQANLAAYDADPNAVLAVLPPPTRAALHQAADIAEDVAESLRAHHEFERSTGALDVMTELRRLAAEAQQPTSPTAFSPDEGIHGRDPYYASGDTEPQQQPDTETQPSCPDPIECSHEAALGEARATNQRLNLRAQQLESELAAYRRAVGQWEVSERGTYIPHSSLRAIGKACGVDILGSVRHLKHFVRVEQAEAAIDRVRHLHDRLAEETDLASPDDPITRAAAAKRIAAALDGWTPPAAPAQPAAADTREETGA